MEKLKISKQKLYEFALCLWIIIGYINRCTIITVFPELMSIVEILVYVVYIVLILKCIYTIHYTCKELIYIIFMILIFGVSYFNSNYAYLFQSILFMISIKNINIDKCFRKALIINLCCFSIIILTSKLGLIPNLINYRNGVYRQCYGFTHPNVFGQYSLVISLLWIYSRYTKIKSIDFLKLLVFNFIVSIQADSRGAFVGAILAIMMIFWFRYFIKDKKNRQLIKMLAVIAIPAFLIISVIISYIDPSQVRVVDELMGYRLTYQHIAVKQYGISLFGQLLDFYDSISRGYYYVDNGYIVMLVYYGIIPTMIFLGAYIIGIKKAVDNRQDPIFVWLIIYAIYGFVQGFSNIQYNLVLLYVGACCFGGIVDTYQSENSDIIV